MASAIQSSVLLSTAGQEHLILVSGLGMIMHLYQAVSDAANRQTNIDAALKQLDDTDAAITAYSQHHNVPVDGFGAVCVIMRLNRPG